MASIAAALAAIVATVPAQAAQPIGLEAGSSTIRLSAGRQAYVFQKDEAGAWALDGVEVAGIRLAEPKSARDGFYLGGGTSLFVSVDRDDSVAKQLTFRLANGAATYRVAAADRLPLLHVEVRGTREAAVAWRTSASSVDEHGAWATRGETASDAEGREAFIDGSGPAVFGHSHVGAGEAGDEDYVVLADVNRHIQSNGRSEQRSDTWFGARRSPDGRGAFRGEWQLRMGPGEPKHCALLFDRGLSRFSAVCERYYAAVVDTLLATVDLRSGYDPARAVALMPLRLSSPDAFIPGMGWVMDEYPDASYPFAHDSSIQTGNFLVYEGLATARNWERGFGKYVLDHSPIVGPDRQAFNVRRPGGITRWGYTTDYRRRFPRLDGGSWGDTEALYRTAQITGDRNLRHIAVEMMRHDVEVKLDLERMTFPPCWDCMANRPGDHRDDWATTTLLAYCAEISANVLYPETHDHTYLERADSICRWFRDILAPERRMNYLHGGVNAYNCWSGWIPAALIHAFERSHDAAYLDCAKDVAWVQILTLCITADRDAHGQPLTGVTCVGVRGCVDYDCAPNLCQEKDLFFDRAVGALLDHASGPAYARYLALQRFALPRDRWNDAFGVQELRGTNLRTMYDTWARGIANLAYGLDTLSDPALVVLDKTGLKCDPAVAHSRDLVLANPAARAVVASLRVRFLQPGRYRVRAGSAEVGTRTAAQLAAGIPVTAAAGSTTEVVVTAVALSVPPPPRPVRYDTSVRWLSDMPELAAQRGVGLPSPTFAKDRGFRGGPLTIHGHRFAKGLGCAANTVIVFDLAGRYRRLSATVGIDDAVARAADPPPSVTFTVFVDGVCRFDSGTVTAHTASLPVDVNLASARTLVLRVSDNWDDNGRSGNDLGNWADARLVGRAVQSAK